MKTTKEKIAVMQAFVEGKKIQYTTPECNDWGFIDAPEWNWLAYDYRIAHEPKLRPWKPEEVPVGALLRLTPPSCNSLPNLILSTNENNFTFAAGGALFELCSFKSALRNYQYSLDHGKTWRPCGIKE